jgi:hypothetical protein
MILTVILAFVINAVAFSMENRLALGFEYGNFFENSTDSGVDINKYVGSPGINMSFYHLWDNLGFFHSYSYLFPITVSSNVGKYEYFFRFNFMVGPAYKIAFTEKIDMNLGIGFSLGPTIGELNNRVFSQFSMGIGGDAGVSFFLNKMAYINIGGIFTYHFANITRMGTGNYVVDEDGDRDEIKNTAWSDNYSMLGVRPYIRFGIKLDFPRVK